MGPPRKDPAKAPDPAYKDCLSELLAVVRREVEFVRKLRSSVWRDVLVNSGDWGDASCVLLGISSIVGFLIDFLLPLFFD